MTDRLSIMDVLEGSFVQATGKTPSPTSANPIARAQYQLVRELVRMQAPSIGVNAEPEEFEDVADYVTRVCSLFDMWLQAVGIAAASNALCPVDQKMFCTQFVGAVEGNATHELDCCAEAAREAQDVDAFADYREAEEHELGHS